MYRSKFRDVVDFGRVDLVFCSTCVSIKSRAPDGWCNTTLHRAVTSKSVSINFGSFVDAAGVTAKIDGTAGPSPKVVKVTLEEQRILRRRAGSGAPFCIGFALSIVAHIKMSNPSKYFIVCQ